jgi:hypothetical protein
LNEVKFKSENGGFLTFEYGGVKYLIKDRRSGNGYEHALFSQNTKATSITMFEEILAVEMAKVMADLQHESNQSILYENRHYIYRFNKQTSILTQTAQPEQLTEWFSSITACKKYAVDLISKRIQKEANNGR